MAFHCHGFAEPVRFASLYMLDQTHDIYAVRYHGFFVPSEQCAESVAHAWMLAMVRIGAPDYAARVYVKGEKT